MERIIENLKLYCKKDPDSGFKTIWFVKYKGLIIETKPIAQLAFYRKIFRPFKKSILTSDFLLRITDPIVIKGVVEMIPKEKLYGPYYIMREENTMSLFKDNLDELHRRI